MIFPRLRKTLLNWKMCVLGILMDFAKFLSIKAVPTSLPTRNTSVRADFQCSACSPLQCVVRLVDLFHFNRRKRVTAILVCVSLPMHNTEHLSWCLRAVGCGFYSLGCDEGGFLLCGFQELTRIVCGAKWSWLRQKKFRTDLIWESSLFVYVKATGR